MTSLFATLGFTAKLAMAPLRDYPELEQVHVFVGTPLQKEGEAALKACRATCDTLQKELTVHRVKGAFDYDALLEAFATAHSQVQEPVMFNASGGTRIMTVASTIFCFTNGVPMVYYDEYETTKGKEIPLRAFRALRTLGESQLGVLKYLEANGASDMTTLAEALGLAPSTLSSHVGVLKDSGLVTVRKAGKRRMVSGINEIMTVGVDAPKVW